MWHISYAVTVSTNYVLTLLTASGPWVGRLRGQSSSPSRCRTATDSCCQAYQQVLCHITCHIQGDVHTPQQVTLTVETDVGCDTVFVILGEFTVKTLSHHHNKFYYCVKRQHTRVTINNHLVIFGDTGY